MILQDITILKNIHKITNFKNFVKLVSELKIDEVCEEPSDITLTFLSSLLESEFFQDYVDYIRIHKKLAYETKDYCLDGKPVNLEKNNKLFIDNKDKFEFIRKTLLLPEYFNYILFQIIVFKCVVDFLPDEHIDLWYAEDINDIEENIKIAKEDKFPMSAILINKYTKKNELIKWIKEEWYLIEKQMKRYLPVNPFIESRIKDIKYVSQVYSLYKQAKSNQEIIEELTKNKSAKEADYIIEKITDTWINNKIRRFKSIVVKNKNIFESSLNGESR